MACRTKKWQTKIFCHIFVDPKVDKWLCSRSLFLTHVDFPGGSMVKILPVNAGGMDSIPGSERSPGVENGHQL